MPAEQTIEMSGGQALAEMLRLHEAGAMFGMGGFQLLPYYDAIRERGMPHHLINDERSGAFAADAWARVSNRPGVCDATLGPGATNLATALTESFNAGVPIIAITGDTHRAHSGKNMTQEARQLETLRPSVKAIIRVEVGERIPEHVRAAYALATSGRPGPVLIDVPEDIAHGVFDYPQDDLRADPSTLQFPSRRMRPATVDLERAAAMLAAAEHPLILAGGGVHLSQGDGELTALAEEYGIPVANTLSGAGAIAGVHPLALGLFGRYSRTANDVLGGSDCIFVVGCKLGEIATRRYDLLPAGVPLIHLDIEPAEIGRWAETAVGLWGDVRETLHDLRAAMAEHPRLDRSAYLAEVAAGKARWFEQVTPRLTSDERPINMARLCHELNLVLPEDALLVADGGFAAHWTGLLYDTKRAGRNYIVDRGLASIGYGVPGAMGAQLAAPDRPVVSLTGDGGLNMTLGDLETAARIGLPITVIVVNNAASGYVKALQHAMFGAERYQSSDLSELNYARVAETLGCTGLRVESPEQIAPALRDGLAERGRPTLIDVVVTRDPGQMLPGVDNRSAPIRKGDRVA